MNTPQPPEEIDEKKPCCICGSINPNCGVPSRIEFNTGPMTPQPPENIGSVMREILNELTEKVTDYGYNLTSYEAGVAAGRSSMKKDIEAVVPEKEDCTCAKGDPTCFECGFNDCRFELLDNIKGIV